MSGAPRSMLLGHRGHCTVHLDPQPRSSTTFAGARPCCALARLMGWACEDMRCHALQVADLYRDRERGSAHTASLLHMAADSALTTSAV